MTAKEKEELAKKAIKFLNKELRKEEKWEKTLEGDIRAFQNDPLYFDTKEITLRQMYIRIDQLNTSIGRRKGLKCAKRKLMNLFKLEED